MAICAKEGVESTRVEMEVGSDCAIEPGSRSNLIMGTCYHPPEQKSEENLR